MTDTEKRNLVAQWAFDARPVLLRFHLWLEDVEVERSQTNAVSDHAFTPRGIEFLLLKNRLNVAISRAKWAAYLLYSPGLLDALPRRPDGVAQLSAFIRLVGADVPETVAV